MVHIYLKTIAKNVRYCLFARMIALEIDLIINSWGQDMSFAVFTKAKIMKNCLTCFMIIIRLMLSLNRVNVKNASDVNLRTKLLKNTSGNVTNRMPLRITDITIKK